MDDDCSRETGQALGRAGEWKQTLRQYYLLPERGVHTALGDLCAVTNLFATVLRALFCLNFDHGSSVAT